MRWVLLFWAIAAPAHAYIDPNAGGLIAQIVTPLLILLAIFWTKLRALAARSWMLIRRTFNVRTSGDEP
jgi:hypothetical protein